MWLSHRVESFPAACRKSQVAEQVRPGVALILSALPLNWAREACKYPRAVPFSVWICQVPAAATTIQTTRSHKPLSGQLKIPQIFAANQLASKNLTPSCRASHSFQTAPRLTLSPFDIWPKPSHPPCRIAFLSLRFSHPSVRFGSVWFGLVWLRLKPKVLPFILLPPWRVLPLPLPLPVRLRLQLLDLSRWTARHGEGHAQ